MQVKVLKFGGSSLADAEQMKKVAAIVNADPACHYVIPSAPGKRFDGDDKVTDLLYRCYELSKEDVEEYCKALPRYKRPRVIIFDKVPRNPTGKIEKPRLRKKYNADALVAKQTK